MFILLEKYILRKCISNRGTSKPYLRVFKTVAVNTEIYTNDCLQPSQSFYHSNFGVTPIGWRSNRPKNYLDARNLKISRNINFYSRNKNPSRKYLQCDGNGNASKTKKTLYIFSKSIISNREFIIDSSRIVIKNLGKWTRGSVVSKILTIIL